MFVRLSVHLWIFSTLFNLYFCSIRYKMNRCLRLKPYTEYKNSTQYLLQQLFVQDSMKNFLSNLFRKETRSHYSSFSFIYFSTFSSPQNFVFEYIISETTAQQNHKFLVLHISTLLHKFFFHIDRDIHAWHQQNIFNRMI